MEKSFYVYVIYRKDNNKPFYVGKGTSQRYGVWHNRNENYNSIRDEFGAYHKILFNNLTEEEALELEEQTILELREFYELTNISNGGKNGNLGLKMDEKHKSKVSEAVKRQWQNPITRKRLEESRAKAYAKPEVRKRMSDAHKGKILSEEHKKKISKSIKDSDVVKKIKESNRKYRKAKVYTKEGYLICEFDTVKECVEFMNEKFYVNAKLSTVLGNVADKRKSAYGYVWKAEKFKEQGRELT